MYSKGLQKSVRYPGLYPNEDLKAAGCPTPGAGCRVQVLANQGRETDTGCKIGSHLEHTYGLYSMEHGCLSKA